MLFKNVNLTLLFAAICVNTIPLTAYAESPVVIEFFGKNNCVGDTKVQDFLQETLKIEKNIIVIDCRIRFDETEKQKTENKKFSYRFCTDRLTKYINKFRRINKFSIMTMIINGHIDANINDIMPAINYARTDNAESISLELKGNILNVSVPEITSDIKSGEIILHTYNISSNDKNPHPLASSLPSDIVNQFYLRPIISIETIGEWRGGAININYSLNHIDPMTKLNYKDFGYIVTLHENDSYGKILAAGEIVPIEERNKTLLLSLPNQHNIENSAVQTSILNSTSADCACSTAPNSEIAIDQEL